VRPLCGVPMHKSSRTLVHRTKCGRRFSDSFLDFVICRLTDRDTLTCIYRRFSSHMAPLAVFLCFYLFYQSYTRHTNTGGSKDRTISTLHRCMANNIRQPDAKDTICTEPRCTFSYKNSVLCLTSLVFKVQTDKHIKTCSSQYIVFWGLHWGK